MRNNKHLLFATLGFISGCCGSLIAEWVPEIYLPSPIGNVLRMLLWTASFASILTLGLITAGEIYNRRPAISLVTLRKGLPAGAFAGAIAGAVAQSVYTIQMDSDLIRELVFKPACWALMGGLIGWRLGSAIPNLGFSRSICGGLLGGFLGGLAFIFSCEFLPEALGRMLGVGLLGVALALAIVTIETMLRAAYLEIIWAPKEITQVTLGKTAVSIGGGDDHIYVRGLPQNAALVVLDQGKINYINKSTNQHIELKDGSKLQIGSITIVVKAK